MSEKSREAEESSSVIPTVDTGTFVTNGVRPVKQPAERGQGQASDKDE